MNISLAKRFVSRLIMLSLLAITLPSLAQAAIPLTLGDTHAEYLLGTHLEMLRDPSGKLTIDEVSSPDISRRFAPVKEKRPNLGYTRDAIWFRFTVKNNTNEPNWI
jgi:hypothetical protein